MRTMFPETSHLTSNLIRTYRRSLWIPEAAKHLEDEIEAVFLDETSCGVVSCYYIAMIGGFLRSREEEIRFLLPFFLVLLGYTVIYP